jgi:allantoate deiminase
MNVNIERIKQDLDTINSFNSTPGKGVTRLTFSREYQQAYNYLIDELKLIGAVVSICRGGCIRGRLLGSNSGKPAVMCGSHIDTVPNGGRFDGQVGTVLALEIARVIVEQNVAHSHPIDVVVFTEEEGSRFGMGMAGSSAWTGGIDLQTLYEREDKDGIKYMEAMALAGVEVQEASPLHRSVVKAMLEVHIEQSVVLDKKGLSIGVIDSIAGAKLYDLVVNGRADHAGGTPMSFRKDALQGMARIVSAVEDIAANRMGPHTVATCGWIKAEPGAVNVIPGQASATLDLRDADAENLNTMPRKIREFAQRVCEERGLELEMSQRFGVRPVQIPRYLVDLIERKAAERGIKAMRMMSGALHDSCKLAEVTDIGMIFVPSKEGRSHCPEEWTDLKHIKNAGDILLDTVIELSR